MEQVRAEALDGELERGAIALGVALAPAQRRALLDYLAELDRWNARINLTAIRDAADQLRLHLLDSLAVIPVLDAISPSFKTVVDVGSGAGLPGVAVAIARPEVSVVCIDAVAKKTAFIRHIQGVLGLERLTPLHARVETLRPDDLGGPAEIIVSRAFASLADFVAWTRPLLAPQGAWVAMKGRRPDDEIADLPPDVRIERIVPLAVPGVDAERHAIVLRRRPDTP